MSKQENFAKPTIVLTAICLVVSAALAGTFAVTNPIIEKNKRIATEKALIEVLPGADSFGDSPEGLPEGVVTLQAANNGVGSVAKVSVKGYGGPVVMVVGIDPAGVITGVKVLESTETQGLGSRVTDPEYTQQFVGKSEASEVASIAGATVTSEAVKKGVTLAKDAALQGKG